MHTKGPWAVTYYRWMEDGAAPTGRRPAIVSDGTPAEGAVIAAQGGGVCTLRRRMGPTAMADARLIAAAPEILEALRNLMRVAFDAAVNSVPEAHVTLRGDLLSLCGQARDLLARVEG